MLHSVMWVSLCIPGHIHCSCSTVMALLCIPLSELVSFAFSTIPICPFLILSIFHLLIYVYICSMGQTLLANSGSHVIVGGANAVAADGVD